MKSTPLPAFQDNYLWLLHDGQRALVVGVEAILVKHSRSDSARSKLKFATAVEPGGTQLIHYRQQCARKRSHGEPTLPSTIGVENGIHPFLRARQPAEAQAADRHGPLAVFAALRPWKNESRQ